jgi:hypothetical protein
MALMRIDGIDGIHSSQIRFCYARRDQRRRFPPGPRD